MLYILKTKPLQITKNTKDVLIIKRPQNQKELYLKLVIYVLINIISVYYTIVYYKSIQSMNSFLLMACAVPIIYTFISATALISEIIGYKITFDKQSGKVTSNSKIICEIKNIEQIELTKRNKEDNFKEWIKYKLIIKTKSSKDIVLATSKTTQVLSKLAIAISTFLQIQLKTEENTSYKITKQY